MAKSTSSDTITKLFEIKNTLFAQMDIIDSLIEQENTPRLAKFKVTLELTTDPENWAMGEANEDLIRKQIMKCMFGIKKALEFDDESDEVKLLAVEQVS